MPDFLRALRVGAVTFFGVMIPGFLMLFFLLIGFLIPSASVIFNILSVERKVILTAYFDNIWVVATVFLTFSYVLGYVIRLSTPDDLDRLSARKLESRNCHSPDVDDKKYGSKNAIYKLYKLMKLVPFCLCKIVRKFSLTPSTWVSSHLGSKVAKGKDSFPYRELRSYLEERGLKYLADFVTWEKPLAENTNKPIKCPILSDKWDQEQKPSPPSKAPVNIMKYEVMLHCPELSGAIESIEAHIRLMSGSWVAIRASLWPITALTLALVSIVIYQSKGAPPGEGIVTILWDMTQTKENQIYILFLFFNILLITAMLWIKSRIQSLFHYRRVHELVLILHAYSKAKKRSDENNKKGLLE